MTTTALSRLNLWQKLGALVLAMILPAILVGFFYFTAMGGQLSQARDELAGARYLSAVEEIESAVLTHAGRAFAVASGDAASRSGASAARNDVTQAFERAAAVDAALGPRFGVSDSFSAAKSEWAALAGATAQQNAEQGAIAHAQLFDRLAQLSAAIAAASRIASDPDRTTHGLLEIASIDAPAALSDAASLRRYAVDAAAKGYLGGDDHMGIDISDRRLQADLEAIETAVGALPPSIRDSLTPLFQDAATRFQGFHDVVGSQLLNAATVKVSNEAMYEVAAPMDAALRKLLMTSSDAADAALQARASSLAAHRNLTALLALLALGGALALARLIRLALSRPLTRAIDVFENISQGRYDNEIDTSRTDEAGQVLQALAAMQEKLRGQIENERAVAAQNSRIRHALDKTSTCVVLADAQHRIIYLNDAAQATFARHAAQLRDSLPAFDPARLRGSSLETLAADPQAERRMLDALAAERLEERTLGGLAFRIVSNRVTGGSGERLGTVMEWTQRTQEVRVEQELQGMLAAVNGGDLTRRIDLSHKSGFFQALGAGVNRLTESLVEIVSRVKDAGREVAAGTDEIIAGNSNLSLRTEEQASSLEETASSMEEMTTTVRQNADNAAQANQLAIAARGQAEQGGAVVGKAVEAMSEINESAKKIADIIGVIDEIAFQTNLLALNAAVEAARAGEQGRGFAVVASEVRSLAGRSATAAKEIKSLIEDSVRKVEDGSRLVTRSGRTLGEIVTSVKKVSDIVAEIAAASREQSSGIEQVNRAVVQMDELTQQNAALVEEATAASQAVAGQVRELNEMLARFDLGTQASGAPRAAASPQVAARAASHSAPRAAPRAASRAASTQARQERVERGPDARRAAGGGEWIEA